MLGARRRDDHLAVVFARISHVRFRTAEIAFGDCSLPIVRDARLRECELRRSYEAPTSEIEQRRCCISRNHSPTVESYSRSWSESRDGLVSNAQFDAGTILMIGHRATFYSLEHLLTGDTSRSGDVTLGHGSQAGPIAAFLRARARSRVPPPRGAPRSFPQ
jgi:hypothetical protein